MNVRTRLGFSPEAAAFQFEPSSMKGALLDLRLFPQLDHAKHGENPAEALLASGFRAPPAKKPKLLKGMSDETPHGLCLEPCESHRA